MDKRRVICVRQAELPVPVVVIGSDGQREVFELAPAGGRKIGAYLRKATELIRRAVAELPRRRSTEG